MICKLKCSKRLSGCGDMYSDMYENSLDMQIDMLGYTYNEHIITKMMIYDSTLRCTPIYDDMWLHIMLAGMICCFEARYLARNLHIS